MTPLPLLNARHYQAIGGLALVAIFLIQYEQNVYLPLNFLMLIVGTLSILYRYRITPLLIFLVIAAGHLLEQHEENRFLHPDFRPFRFMDISDVMLCMATLTYVIAHYRLQGWWFHVFPYDGGEPRSSRQTKADPPNLIASGRTETTVAPEELIWLLIPIPGFVLAAELFGALIKQRWALAVLPPQWHQLMATAWITILVIFVGAHFFRHWRRLQMNRPTAELLLQDTLWNETRGEQRRIQRWFVWRKLKKQEER